MCFTACTICRLSDDSDCRFCEQKMAGYGLDECNAAKEVQKAKLPILFIHGDKDTFVPCSMCDELYASCASQKTKLIVKGAGHCESYYKNTKAFEDALDKFWKEL